MDAGRKFTVVKSYFEILKLIIYQCNNMNYHNKLFIILLIFDCMHNYKNIYTIIVRQ